MPGTNMPIVSTILSRLHIKRRDVTTNSFTRENATTAEATSTLNPLDAREQELISAGGDIAHQLCQLREETNTAQSEAEKIAILARELRQVFWSLEKAGQKMEDVCRLGVAWAKSDDSSDDRHKRQWLQETVWDLLHVQRDWNELQARFPDAGQILHATVSEIASLASDLEPLVEKIDLAPCIFNPPDPMLDSNLSGGRERLLSIVAQVDQLQQTYATYDSQAQQRLDRLKRHRRTFLLKDDLSFHRVGGTACPDAFPSSWTCSTTRPTVSFGKQKM